MWDACKRPLANLVIDINGCVHALILVIASLKIAECMAVSIPSYVVEN